MHASDTTLRVTEISVEPIVGEDGKTREVRLILGTTSFVPMGPQQLLPVPVAVYRVPLPKEGLEGLVKTAQTILDQMDDPSPLEIAQDLRGVEAAAKRAREVEIKLR